MFIIGMNELDTVISILLGTITTVYLGFKIYKIIIDIRISKNQRANIDEDED
jgi:hypothetical protein